ncbi:thiol-disulfide oxidoreductase ResA [Bacillus sp. SA1-12]|uniref:thiol-disulfide oxidoreductase ResA n=1 Tax=Bacillus sp. SA1-12 TaxID=1455638 RepID=UPI000696722E|nr:thiol-disulfide oxidoreductase ResA [Bacillus sp. SA1-12]
MKTILIVRLSFLSILIIAAVYVFYNEVFKEQEVVAAKVGYTAPDFTLKHLDRIEQTLSDHGGKGIVLNFWATYCPPCEKEMPYLENAYQKYKNQGVDILAVNVAEPTLLVNQYVTNKNLTFQILLDRDGVVAEQYQVQNLPITFFIDSNGEIIDKVSGELTEAKLKKGIEMIQP